VTLNKNTDVVAGAAAGDDGGRTASLFSLTSSTPASNSKMMTRTAIQWRSSDAAARREGRGEK